LIPVPPLPEELPANTVAIVSNVPGGAGRITRAKFQHALAQAAAAAGRRSAPKPGGNGYRKLKLVALREQLDGAWIRGQAAEMGIGLRRRQVARELARLKKGAFKDKAQYNRFLKEARYTRRDVKERVEVQMFATRIQERIAEGVEGEAAVQKAFERFVAEYGERWKGRTVCAPEYVFDRCSNSAKEGQPSSLAARTPASSVRFATSSLR
jgi:hypothetical protein